MPVNPFFATQAPTAAQTPTGAAMSTMGSGLGNLAQAIQNQFLPQQIRSQMFARQMLPLSIMSQSPLMSLMPSFRDAWGQAFGNTLQNVAPGAPYPNFSLSDAFQNALYKKGGNILNNATAYLQSPGNFLTSNRTGGVLGSQNALSNLPTPSTNAAASGSFPVVKMGFNNAQYNYLKGLNLNDQQWDALQGGDTVTLANGDQIRFNKSSNQLEQYK